jgi:uncharacterized protein with HEPN domain
VSQSIQRETAKLLLDVSNACQEVLDYCEDLSEEIFLADRTMQHVIAHLTIIIGEALRRAERLDGSLSEAIPQLRDVVDTRNRIVHGYDSISYELLWDIAVDDIDPLKHAVDQLIQKIANNRMDTYKPGSQA